ncbi:MAG: helix-turn-helix domain-containing protein [Sphingomonadaceae bacterium]
MPAFAIMERHAEAARLNGAAGSVIFSRLGRGESAIAADAVGIKFVLDGEELYEVDGRMIRVEAGQFLYLDAGSECRALVRREAIGLCLGLPRPVAAGETADPLLGRSLLLSARTSGFGRFLDRQARLIARQPELGRELAGRLLARARSGLEEPLAESRNAIAALDTARPSTRRALFQKLERARDHIHAHELGDISLAGLAAVAGVSQFHLARCFKLAFGETPIAYHRRLRLARAREELDRGAGLARAAEAVGYSDATALSHALRRHRRRSAR